MPDVLTEAEKAAIENYSGPIYKAKLGESGIVIGESAINFNKYNRAMQARRKAENEKIRHFRSLGMDDAEIADNLGMKLGTVKSRRYRGNIA